MYLLFTKLGEFSGFSYGNLTDKEKEDGFNIKEITDEEHKTYIEKTNMKGYTYYLENDEVVERSPKPDLFHIWDMESKEWNYKKDLEINFINIEKLEKETELNNLYDTLDKATARRLKALIADTQHKIDKIIEELETLEKRLKELEG